MFVNYLKLSFVPTNVPISFFREYQLVVDVVDINDNAPSFGQPEYSFSVTEVCHVTINWRACRANATDMRRNNISVSESTIYFAVEEWFECWVSIQDRSGKSYYLLYIPNLFAGSSTLFDLVVFEHTDINTTWPLAPIL